MRFSKPVRLGASHQVGDFDCGEHALNDWLQKHALNSQASDGSRVFVSTTEDDNVAGFYALVAGSIETDSAPDRVRKGQPVRPIPVILLARLAVDERFQGEGLGASLLQSALLRCSTVADEIGIRAVLVHAKHDEARAFYERYGFEHSPTDRLHLVLLMKDLRRLLTGL